MDNNCTCIGYGKDSYQQLNVQLSSFTKRVTWAYDYKKWGVGIHESVYIE